MNNVDIKKSKKEELLAKAAKVLNGEEIENSGEVVQEYLELVAKEAAEEVATQKINAENDVQILNKRGQYQLTAKERKAYDKIIEAMQSNRPQEALTDAEAALEITTINRVFDELTQEHPLLNLITINNTTGITRTIVNKGDTDAAWWGKLSEEIKKDLETSFEVVTTNLYKLSAYIPVVKEYLKLGADWLDTYVRKVLKESLAKGLVKGIIVGTGKDQPVGMNVDIEAEYTPNAARPVKTAIEISDLEPKTIGPVIAKLTNGGKRAVERVALIMNPVDYWKKIFPATTSKNLEGKYIRDQFCFPVDFIQEPYVEEGQAIIGLPEKYDLNVGIREHIEYDDSVKFLDDERVYVAKLDANGSPRDNNAFFVLDITNVGVEDTNGEG